MRLGCLTDRLPQAQCAWGSQFEQAVELASATDSYWRAATGRPCNACWMAGWPSRYITVLIGVQYSNQDDQV
jgi:hypothetical protein